jgi:hypothetical protein
MAIVPFEHTNFLLTQWTNNEFVASETVVKAVTEAREVDKKDENDPTLPQTHKAVSQIS